MTHLDSNLSTEEATILQKVIKANNIVQSPLEAALSGNPENQTHSQPNPYFQPHDNESQPLLFPFSQKRPKIHSDVEESDGEDFSMDELVTNITIFKPEPLLSAPMAIKGIIRKRAALAATNRHQISISRDKMSVLKDMRSRGEVTIDIVQQYKAILSRPDHQHLQEILYASALDIKIHKEEELMAKLKAIEIEQPLLLANELNPLMRELELDLSFQEISDYLDYHIMEFRGKYWTIYLAKKEKDTLKRSNNLARREAIQQTSNVNEIQVLTRRLNEMELKFKNLLKGKGKGLKVRGTVQSQTQSPSNPKPKGQKQRKPEGSNGKKAFTRKGTK